MHILLPTLGWEENRNSKSAAGIIYCRTRDGTEEIAAQMRKCGLTCQVVLLNLNNVEIII